MKIQLNKHPILRDIANGLVLTRTIPADADAVAEFNSHIHSDDAFDKPDQRVAAWTRDLLARPHPTFQAGDFTLVVESATGKIVSAMNLIPQTWAYEGIPFSVGRPELVGTLPEFRNRGLVRLQFEEIHQWSHAYGNIVQGITGIPFYYRLFGYEMGMELGGGRMGFEANLPRLKDGENEPFTFRLAAEADIPFLMEVYAHAGSRQLITCVREPEIWRYTLVGESENNVNRLEVRIIQRVGSGEPVGYITHSPLVRDGGLGAFHYELKPGVSWLEVSPSVLRCLWQTAQGFMERDGQPSHPTNFAFWCGSEHPCYDILRSRLPSIRDPYAWYLRVPDLPRFLHLIAPALERHIAESSIVGFSGEAKISFYRSGLRLVLEKGKLVNIESWQPRHEDQGSASFPDLTFLQLVFGYRSFDELEQSYADCMYKSDETRVLMNTLFPKRSSSVMFVN